MEKVIPTYKIAILGDTNVGKTSLFVRYLRREFRDIVSNTIAVDYNFRKVFVNGEEVHLKIWDTAGQEKFKSIVSQLYRDADGFILVYDVNSRRSFSEMTHLIREIGSNLDPKMTVIVGNKIDTVGPEDRKSEEKLLKEFCETKKFKYFLTSAKTGVFVDDLFLYLAGALYYGKNNIRKSNEIKKKKKWRGKFCL